MVECLLYHETDFINAVDYFELAGMQVLYPMVISLLFENKVLSPQDSKLGYDL